MSSWSHAYRSKRTSLEQAVAAVGPGETIYLGGNAATPRTLGAALARRGEAIRGSRIAHVLLIGEDPFAAAAAAGHVRHLSWFVGPADRSAIAAGQGDYVPCHLSEIPRLMRTERPRIDTALLMTAPPDRHGLLSLGVEVLASQAASQCAGRVIVQVNEQMPRVLGNSFIRVDDVDALVEADEPLAELAPSESTTVERRIAEQIVELLPEGATLQLGIGGIPQALISMIRERHDLGIHSEMISDGVMEAYEAGVLSGRRKTRHRGKIVATFALGTRPFIRLAPREQRRRGPSLRPYQRSLSGLPERPPDRDQLGHLRRSHGTGERRLDRIPYLLGRGRTGRLHPGRQPLAGGGRSSRCPRRLARARSPGWSRDWRKARASSPPVRTSTRS